MASFKLLLHADRDLQSPAKVFAMLKSKVQKEAKCAKEGLFTSQDISCNVSETHGAELFSPRENAANFRIAEELKENHRYSNYRNEAQALTLSPISSPTKHTCSDISSIRLEETSPGNENGRGYARRDGFVMESTAISSPPSVVNRNHIIDTGGLNVSNRTPVKRQVENYGKNVLYAKCGPLSKAMSPGEPKKIPLENVIYLRKWFLRKDHQGLFVNGIHNEDNIPWNSNIIVDRISNSVLKTVSGRVYILVGNMKMDVASDFPKWLLKKFASGFPQNWKTLYEKFLQESKESERKNDRKYIKAKPNPEASSIIRSVKGHKRRATRTPEFVSPTHSFSTQVSRSGRLIKPPLDYWKGGRVLLDAKNNVIVYEGYDTLQSDTSIKVSPRATPKPVCVIVPNCRKAVVAPFKKPATLIEPTVEMLSSPEEWCGRRTTSSQRARGLYVNAAPQKQSEPSTGRLKQAEEIPSLCLSDDCNFQMSDVEPQTPMSSHYPEVKTPQCLLITPGMMGSPNAVKKNLFNVCKNSPSKKFTPTLSLKRRRCGNTENDSLVFEMLGENDGARSESEEEEDFYFSDN